MLDHEPTPIDEQVYADDHPQNSEGAAGFSENLFVLEHIGVNILVPTPSCVDTTQPLFRRRVR